MAGPSVATVKRLFAVSGNRCAFPGCAVPLVDEASGKVTGRVCHIKADSPDGPRYNAGQSEEERHGFANLVLMCPLHHDVIDSDVEKYTVERLLEIKARHEARYAGGAESSDAIARQSPHQLAEVNVVGDHNVATVNKQSAGDYAIQIGQLHLTLSLEQLRSLLVSPVSASALPPPPVSAPTASPLPAASTGLPRQLKVFLCHASGDKPAVRDLYRRLRSDGIAPWLDEEDLLPGQDWPLEIPKAVRSSDAVIICLSSRAITKAGYVQREIKYALDVADEQPEGALCLIPLRLEECEAPERLRRWQWVDLFQRPGYERLLRALRARAESLGLATLPFGSATSLDLGTHPFWPARDRWRNPKDGKEMVRVPAGRFLYGDDKREVELPEFWIDKAPVTNAEYARFVAETRHKRPEHWKGKTPPREIADHPVTYVSWDDAAAYATWAGGLLPTEEEWEKAARGTDGREYPWGEWADGCCNWKEAGIGTTTPVGKYSPQGDSPYGCVDMAGNVWEWTTSEREQGGRVLRGGAFLNEVRRVRCAARYWSDPLDRFRFIGFRVVEAPVGL